MTAETIALALSLAALGAPKSFVADVSLRLAMPDSVAGKSDGMRVRLLAITSAGEQTVAEQDIAPPGWHVVKGRCRLRAGEAYTLRLVLGPGEEPRVESPAAGEERRTEEIPPYPFRVPAWKRLHRNWAPIAAERA